VTVEGRDGVRASRVVIHIHMTYYVELRRTRGRDHPCGDCEREQRTAQQHA
jgi:hypothetical protein